MVGKERLEWAQLRTQAFDLGFADCTTRTSSCGLMGKTSPCGGDCGFKSRLEYFCLSSNCKAARQRHIPEAVCRGEAPLEIEPRTFSSQDRRSTTELKRHLSCAQGACPGWLWRNGWWLVGWERFRSRCPTPEQMRRLAMFCAGYATWVVT